MAIRHDLGFGITTIGLNRFAVRIRPKLQFGDLEIYLSFTPCLVLLFPGKPFADHGDAAGSKSIRPRSFPMTSLRLRMLEDMQIRNLAVNTQESYVQQISLFARYFNQSPERLGPEQIRTYQVYLTKEKKLATGSIVIAISALRFLIKSLSRRTGPSKTSSPLRKSLRPCRWSLVPRKSFSFWPAWLTGSTVSS